MDRDLRVSVRHNARGAVAERKTARALPLLLSPIFPTFLYTRTRKTMPYLDVNGCQYFYEDVGDGPETIVFGHGFLMTHRMWDRQVEAFRDRYRCITFDWRGQGWSEVTAVGYSVKALTEDLLRLLDALDVGPFHYVGLSMGGFVGFRLLLRNPAHLLSAALLDTQAGAEEPAAWLRYRAMLFIARYFGYGPLIDRVLPLLFGPAFLNDPAHAQAIERWKSIIMSNDRVGIYRAGHGIFADRPDLLPQLGAIRTPTLLLTGADDVPTPVEKARLAHERLPHSELLVIPAAGHSSAIERPEAVNAVLEHFISEHAAAPAVE